ncbi:MAG: hypothetical protein CL820_02880 [Croceicoccus sp.]|nr:hypothetical protein [Croceicoccus sp.]MAL24828.1 hypothetical protein [Croceicoccus sp.]|tara:strand:- start:13482 stop:14873 length:1392 start_codon:yes stop_codon:yes gene_type:complete
MAMAKTARPSRQRHYDNLEAMFRHDGTVPPAGVLEPGFEDIDCASVPTSRYTSREYHEREIAHLWRKVWQVAGWAADIPEPGDAMTYDVGDIAALVVRQPDLSLKAYHNSCLHRGMRICDGASSLTSLRCPFHGFTWSLDGAVKSVPEKWDFPELQDAELSLPQLHVGEWQGYVMVNPDPDAAPLEDYLGALSQQWSDAGWDLTGRFKAVHVTKKIRANWKVAQEAFMEFMHGNYVHTNSIVPAAPAEAMRQDVFAGEPHFARGIGVAGVLSGEGDMVRVREQKAVDHFIAYYAPELADDAEFEVAPGETARDKIAQITIRKFRQDYGVDLSGLNRFDMIDYVWYNIFPNFMPWPTLGYPLGYWFRPDGGPSNCTMDVILLLPFEGERPPSAERVVVGPDEPTEPLIGPIGRILDEDMANMERIQQGLEASATRTVNFASYNEVRLRHFHRTLGTYVEDVGGS